MQKTWLFDLDNTLHNATPHIFPHINRSMTSYIERHLGVDLREANRIRQDYWQRYGA
ncbi:MAG: pyrimidine 5'-nucleotidase, partial [Rhodocyclales bacterium]|nr:pyrimidine 5'-nucleotidase [Rhodocyclales bacterium]